MILFCAKSVDADSPLRDSHDALLYHWPNNPPTNVVDATPALAAAQLVAEVPELFISGVVQTPLKPTVRSFRQIRTQIASSIARHIVPATFSAAPSRPIPVRPSPALVASTYPSTPNVLTRKPRTSPPERDPANRTLSRRPPIAQPSDLLSPKDRMLAANLKPSKITATAAGSGLNSQVVCRFVSWGFGWLLIGVPFAFIPLNPLFQNRAPPSTDNPCPPVADQGFSIIAKPQQSGWLLEHLEVSIPVGDRPNDLFTPLPTVQDQGERTAAAVGSRKLVTAAAPTTDPDVPPNQTTSSSTPKLPVVKPFSRARRYFCDVSFVYDPLSSVSGTMTVRMTPVSVAVADISQSQDISFVIQETQINWVPQQTYEVQIVEKYREWPGDKTLSGFATTTLTIVGADIPPG